MRRRSLNPLALGFSYLSDLASSYPPRLPLECCAVPSGVSDYFYFNGVVRGMALETFGECVEMYSETLGLRFVVPLIEFFGAGSGVDEDYLPPATTRDGIDPNALAVDVEEGTPALSHDEGGGPLLLQGDDLKTPPASALRSPGATSRRRQAERKAAARWSLRHRRRPHHRRRRARRQPRPSGCGSPASRAT